MIAKGAYCNGLCKYCSGHLIEKDDPKIDFNAMLKTMNSNKNIQNAIKNKESIMFNLWGGEPFTKIKELDTIIDFCEENFPDVKKEYFISTNGILLASKEVIDFLYKHNKNGQSLRIQISHDGLGQDYRTPGFDPFYSDNTRDNVIKLAQDGIFNLINCTLSGKNPSIKGNMFYFNKWRSDFDIPESVKIKLNHINDSDYCSEFNLNGDKLDTYMHEMEKAFMKTYVLGEDTKDWEWSPFVGYFYNQLTRDSLFNGVNGGCAMFSLGMTDETWAMNTLGEYVPCQLWDTPIGIQNPNIEMPDYCNDCEYKIYNECHPCPNGTFPKDKCEYKKAFIRLVLRMKEFRKYIDELKGNSCKCGDGCSCGCGDKKDCDTCEPCNSYR